MSPDEVIIFDTYNVFLKAIQEPEENGPYRFMITIFDNEDDDSEIKRPRIELPSAATYDDYKSAIFDGNGVLELLGYNLDGSIHTLFVLNWNHTEEQYDTVPIKFDGMDFYPFDEVTPNES